MATLTPLQQLAQPVDMTGWPDPYASGDIPTPDASARPSASSSSPSTSRTWADWPPKKDPSSPPSSDWQTALGKWFDNFVTGGASEVFGRSLEDVIFIVIGLILVGAAVFTFKDVQQGVQTVVRTTGKAAEVAG